MKRWIYYCLVVGFVGFSLQASGVELLILNHLYDEPDNLLWEDEIDLDPQSGDTNLTKPQARTLAEDLRQSLKSRLEDDPIGSAMQLANVGMFSTYAGDLTAGQTDLELALNQLQAQHRQYDPELTRIISALGINAFLQENFEVAENYFRRSQHIHHRQDGLFTSGQTANLNWLTRTYLSTERYEEADTAQRHVLQIAQRRLVNDSPQLDEVKRGVAIYLGRRGSTISPLADEMARANRQRLFSEALTLIQEVITSIEQRLGKDVMELIPVLKTKAEIHFWRGGHSRFQDASLERTLAIIQNQPDPAEHVLAETWLDLADSYILTGNRGALEAYRQAWAITTDIFNDNLEQADPATAASAVSPPLMLSPKTYFPLITDYKPKTLPEGDLPELFVDVSFTVSEYGQPRRLRIVDRNVPTDEARLARALVASSRYRPALKEGLAQPYDLSRRVTFVSESFNAESESAVSTAPAPEDGLLDADPNLSDPDAT